MKKDSGNSRQYESPSLKLLFFDGEDVVRTSGTSNQLGWGNWGDGFAEDRSNTFIGGNE